MSAPFEAFVSLLLYLFSVLLTGCGRPAALPGWPGAALGTAGLGNSQELLGAGPGSAAANEQAKAAIFSQNLPTAAGGRNAARSSLHRKMGGGAGTRWKERVRCGAGVALAAGTSRCHLGGNSCLQLRSHR